MGDAPNLPVPPSGIDWIKLHQEMDQIVKSETIVEKMLRKFAQNPLVPIGAAVTTGALTYGLINFIRGKSDMQQKMMRLRVGAQLFTVVAAVGGIFISLPKEKRNYQGLVEAGEKKIERNKT